MERIPQPKARLIVNVMEHGTIVGTDEGVTLEFDDCVNAVQGLASWLGDVLAEVNDEDGYEITSAILIDALHRWTFEEHIHEEGDSFGELSDIDGPEEQFPTN